MGKRKGRKKVLKVRYKDSGDFGSSFGSALVLKGKGKKTRGKSKRRILSVRKVGYEEILSASTPGGVGSYFNPEKLMEEFRQSELQEVGKNERSVIT